MPEYEITMTVTKTYTTTIKARNEDVAEEKIEDMQGIPFDELLASKKFEWEETDSETEIELTGEA